MIVLGIDPGIALVGYAFIEYKDCRMKSLAYGCIQTDSNFRLPERLNIIFTELDDLIQEYKTDEMVLEELFYFKNQKTVMMVAQARGVEVMVGIKNNLPLYEYTPLQVKQAITGYGRATKLQMQKSVQMLLGLKELPRPDDAADALAIACCHIFGQRFKSQNEMR